MNLQLSGSALCEPLTRPLDLYSGSPALLPLALRAQGGSLEIRGETADSAFVQQLVVEPRAAGSGSSRVAALYARNRVEDLELALAAVLEKLEAAAGGRSPMTARHCSTPAAGHPDTEPSR